MTGAGAGLLHGRARGFDKDVLWQLQSERFWGIPSYAATQGCGTQSWKRAVYVLALLVQLQYHSPLVTLAYFVLLSLFY